MAEKERGTGPIQKKHTHLVHRGAAVCSICGHVPPQDESTIYLKGTVHPDLRG